MSREDLQQENEQMVNLEQKDGDISPAIQAALDLVPTKQKELLQRFLAGGILPSILDNMQTGNQDIVDPGVVEGMQRILDWGHQNGPEAVGIVLFAGYLYWGARLFHEKFRGIPALLLHAVGVSFSYAAYYYLENPGMITIHGDKLASFISRFA